jgi:bleomycin hydrolase
MHCIGLAEKDNKKYYILKNSSGNGGVMPGYILMSENYFKLKTISMFVNKNSLPKSVLLKQGKLYRN